MPYVDKFFMTGPIPVTVETGTYQLPLVVLSYLVAAFASYTALNMAQQLVTAQKTWEKRLFHWGGAFAMGAGIWSMHFIGMLSYKMRMVVTYEFGLTILSMIIAIGVAYGVLAIIAREKLTLRRLLVGAVLLGFGICGMHYTGMAAMEMGGMLRYKPGIFSLSVLVAVTAAAAALWMSFTLARHPGRYRYLYQFGAALVMGAGICGMHYVGMLAAVFIPFADCRFDPNQDFDGLALAIAIITSIILVFALAIGFYRRSQAEYKLQLSEARLRLTIDNAMDAIVCMDENGRVTEWNKQAEVIFGWSHADAIGHFMHEMIIPLSFRVQHIAGMKRFLEDGTAPILGQRLQMPALNRNGTEFPIELAITVQQIGSGYNFTAFIRDLTELKKTELELSNYMKELERSNQELEDFAHIASHDLKEPLRGLASLCNFLKEDYKDKLDEQGLQWLNRLTYLSQRMEHLVSDLLYFSQLGRVQLAVQESDPNVMISEIRALLEIFLKERNAAILVPNKLPMIVCDKPRVTEVFRNLITNAVKYNTKSERTVEIGFLPEMETAQGRERNVFYVKDNGIGIAPEFHQPIFRIFKKLDSHIDDKETGTGVGLTFVKKIIERHKGRIWLESEPGQGTTFFFTLNPKR